MSRRTPESPVRGLLLAALLSLCVPGAAVAQTKGATSWSLGVGGEVVSRYIWRGELLDGADVQPDIHVEHGDLTIGVWSAWGLYTRDDLGGRTYKEMDTYVSWDQGFDVGDLILTGTDYYFPGPGDSGRFTNFGGVVNGQATGAHTDEISAEFDPRVVPLTVMVAWNAYNDPDHALFARVGSDVTVPLVAIGLHGDIGFLLKDSPNYYGSLAGHAMDYTLRATRSFSLGGLHPHVSAAVVRAPAVGGTYGVFAIGF